MKFNKKWFVFVSSIILVLMFMLSSLTSFAAGINSWTTKASMSTARYLHQAASVGGRIYAIGGAASGYLNSIEEYDTGYNVSESPTNLKLHFLSELYLAGEI